MSRVNVRKVTDSRERAGPVFAMADALLQHIRQRAFAIYVARGRHDGYALEDWLAAEHEFSWPAVQLSEDERGCEVEFALPGYDPGEIEVTAAPREVIVHARKNTEDKDKSECEGTVIRWSGFRDNDVYRRVELCVDHDVGHVRASLKNGILKVIAPKQQLKPARAPKTARVPKAAKVPATRMYPRR